MDISVVIPLLNEAESLPELTEWIDKVMKENNYSFEIVFVDDGSTDNSWEVIENLKKDYPEIKAIKFRRNYGKSAGLNEAFSQVNGDVVITMDADLQDSPDEIPELYKMIKEEGFDVVSGWKKNRYDPFIKNQTSKIYNGVSRLFSGLKLHDMNCGLKAYKNQVVKSIEVIGEMHRYIPVIAKWAGFTKIGEKVVIHRARKYGVTKFGLSRFINGPLDLLSIMFVSKFGKRPMHFFGSLGIFFIFIGFIILTYLSVDKLLFDSPGIATRPLFFFGILTFIVGTQIFVTGFLAEMILRTSSDRNNYLVDKVID